MADVTLDLIPEGDAGSFHLPNAPGEGFRRVLARTPNESSPLYMRVRISEIHHGKMTYEGDHHQATLIVFEFQFLSRLHARRYQKASMTVEFQDTENAKRDPVVINLAPNRMHWLNKTIYKRTVQYGASLGVTGGVSIASGEANLHWDVEEEKPQKYKATLTGSPGCSKGKTGDENAVTWVMEENKGENDGIPSFLQTAVLLKRNHNRPFTIKLRVRSEVDTTSAIRRFILHQGDKDKGIDLVTVTPDKVQVASSNILNIKESQLQQLERVPVDTYFRVNLSEEDLLIPLASNETQPSRTPSTETLEPIEQTLAEPPRQQELDLSSVPTQVPLQELFLTKVAAEAVLAAGQAAQAAARAADAASQAAQAAAKAASLVADAAIQAARAAESAVRAAEGNMSGAPTTSGYTKEIIILLQASHERFSISNSSLRQIVFVAHNTGAALVKQILLIASEDYCYQWIATQSVALYFLEAPTYLDHVKWEEFLFHLFTMGRIRSSNFTQLIIQIPTALAHIERNFSVISQGFNVQYYNPEGKNQDVYQSPHQDPWNFQYGRSKFEDISLHMRAILRETNITRLCADYKRFLDFVSRPSGSVARLNDLDAAYPETMTWLQNHPSYKTWTSDAGQRCILASSHEWRVTLVINAADQCYDPIASKLASLAAIEPMTNQFKILITSSNLSPQISGAREISVQGHEWQSTIYSIANLRVSRITNKRPVWKGFEEPIVQTLCKGEYNYFHVMLNLDILEHSKMASTKNALTQQLMSPVLPMEKVFNSLVMDKGYRDSTNMKVAINWIIHAIRPLGISELAVALTLNATPAVQGADNNFTLDAIIDTVSWDLVRDMDSFFGPAIKIINDHIFLIHHTFQEYLTKKNEVIMADFNATIVDRCLMYLHLLSDSLDDSARPLNEATDHVDTAMAFLEYAELYWAEHYKLVTAPSIELTKKVTEFLKHDSKAKNTWIRRCLRTFRWENFITENPLFLATQLQLAHNVQNLLEDTTMSITMEDLEKAAIIAASTGDLIILDKLLEKLESTSLVSVLRAAATSGQFSIIKILIDRLDVSTFENLREDTGKESLVLLAALRGHSTAVAELLNKNFTAKAMDESNNTAVHLASRIGDARTLEIIKRLREEDFKKALRQSNGDNLSPLQLACLAGATEAFDLVLSSSPDDQMNQPDGVSMFPIELAAGRGHTTIVRRLLEAGADMNSNRQGSTPLELAAQNGHYDVVCCLAERLLNLNTKDDILEKSEGEQRDSSDLLRSSLSLAVQNGHARVVQYLFSKVQHDANKEHAYLSIAIDKGHHQIVEELVRADVSVHAPQEEDYNPLLDSAISNNHVDIVHFLISKGMRSQWDGAETSFHYAVRGNRIFCLREMLRNASEEDVQKKDWRSNTPLDTAVIYDRFEAFQELFKWQKGQRDSDYILYPPKTLFIAIREHQIKFVQFLLDEGWNANIVSASQDLPLHAALDECDEDIIQLLLNRSADPNAQNKTGDTPLHISVTKKMNKITKLLLEKGANPNVIDAGKFSPLNLAIKARDLPSVRLLLGMDVEGNLIRQYDDFARADHEMKAPGGLTPLLLAISEESDDISLALLKAGAGANASDAKGQTPLHYVASRKPENMDMVKLLIKYQADIDAEKNDHSTPLHAAINSHNHKIASYLLTSAKANPNIYGGKLHSPLQSAVSMEEKELVDQLLAAKADVNAQGGSFGSALHAAVWRGNVELITLLLEHGAMASLNVAPFGTPLHVLSSVPYVINMPTAEITHLLLSKGAIIDALDAKGRTPLVLATKYRDEADIEVLLDHNANTNAADSTGMTVMHYVAQYRCMALIEKVLAKKPDIEIRDKCGYSVLQRATMSYTKEKFDGILETLPTAKIENYLGEVLPILLKKKEINAFHDIIEKCVSINVPDRNGWTSLDIANHYGLVHETELLRKRGAKEGSRKADFPTEWNVNDRHADVRVYNNDAWMETFISADTSSTIPGTVRANRCIPVDAGIFYFEVEILEDTTGGTSPPSTVAIGLIQDYHSLTSLVGWSSGSWGYHSLTVDTNNKTAQFTLDGVRVGRVIKIVGQLYPAVSFYHTETAFTPVKIRANFGTDDAHPFIYGPESMPVN
ncbi:hypothetical protein MKX08_003355 [Trichoderma sp. CBMAI-0020]|nr:hypothetical protein MKX08_003355 [Trichoderma sp. CBMAI-0020]